MRHRLRLPDSRVRRAAAFLLAASVAVPGACGRAAPDVIDTTGAARASAPVPDTLWRPVLLTLRRDSIAWPGAAPMDTVRARIDRAIERLRATSEFEVLDVSPALLVVRIRAPVAGGAAALAESLRVHPLVEATRIEEVAPRR